MLFLRCPPAPACVGGAFLRRVGSSVKGLRSALRACRERTGVVVDSLHKLLAERCARCAVLVGRAPHQAVGQLCGTVGPDDGGGGLHVLGELCGHSVAVGPDGALQPFNLAGHVQDELLTDRVLLSMPI